MYRNACTLLQLAFAFALTTGIPAAVRAGPVEQFVQFIANEAAPQRIAVRYENGNGGLLISEDGGHSFALTCTAVYGKKNVAGLGFMGADGTLWIGSFDGLVQDDGTACQWTFNEELRGHWITDIVADPRDPNVAFVVPNATNEAPNGLYRRSEQGHFEPFGSRDNVIITRLRISKLANGGTRFHESTVKSSESDDGGFIALYALRHSDDGEHWIEHPFPAQSDMDMRLEAVDPTQPDHLIISMAGYGTNAKTHLLYSRDGGASFEPYLDVDSLGGLVVTPEGRVFIGDSGLNTELTSRGLYRAEHVGDPPQLLNDALHVSCLGYRASDSTLFACDRYAFGTADPEDGSFHPRVKFAEVGDLVSCPNQDVGATCKQTLLADYCSIAHFPCAPMCDRYGVDLSDLKTLANSDPELAQCLKRRDPNYTPEPPPDAPVATIDAGAPPIQNSDAGTPPIPTPNAGIPPKHLKSGCKTSAVPTGSNAAPYLFSVLTLLIGLRRRTARRSMRSHGQ